MKRLYIFVFVISILTSLLSACSPGEHKEPGNICDRLTSNPKITNNSEPSVPGNEPDEEPHKKRGNRLPSRPVEVSFIEGVGVFIQGIDKEDVLSYSIYDGDGELVVEYADDVEFTYALFALTGVYEVRIMLDDYYLGGWMRLGATE